MAVISAFADEIDPDPDVQIKVLKDNDVTHVDLRGAWDTNVMKLSDEQCRTLKQKFDDAGVRVVCIGSPIGKVKLDQDLDRHFDDFKHAVELAEVFGCRYVRVFSFYPPDGETIADHRQTVLDRCTQMCQHVAGRDVVLVQENESAIYADIPSRCADLMNELAAYSGQMLMAFDPANFVAVECTDVYGTCWQPLKQYVGYFHMKDKKLGQAGPCVPCGQGDGDIERILADAATIRQDWVLTLEPHLKAAGQFRGSTGPELFKTAADALKALCARVQLPVT